MYNICIDCPHLLNDGLSFCCLIENCEYWVESLKPIPVDIYPLPDEEYFLDEEDEDDVFLFV